MFQRLPECKVPLRAVTSLPVYFCEQRARVVHIVGELSYNLSCSKSCISASISLLLYLEPSTFPNWWKRVWTQSGAKATLKYSLTSMLIPYSYSRCRAYYVSLIRSAPARSRHVQAAPRRVHDHSRFCRRFRCGSWRRP